jgi:hypothetical protein
MRRSLGMVIPVWFPPSLSDDEMRQTLLATLHGCDHFLPWKHVVLVVDGKVCALIIQHAWERLPWVGPEIYRYGVEAVPFVEGVMVGAVLGELTRLTVEPDFSGHGAFARPETNGRVILWTFLRLGFTLDQATIIIDNHLSRLTLWTDLPGREALLQLRDHVLQTLNQFAQHPHPIPRAKAPLYF